MQSAAFTLNPLEDGCPFVWVSEDLCRQMALKADDLIGAGLDRLQKGLPYVHVSRSGKTKMTEFCLSCAIPAAEHIGEVSVVQPCERGDGTRFTCVLMLGLCQNQVLGVQVFCGEGILVRLDTKELDEVTEFARRALLQAQRDFCKESFQDRRRFPVKEASADVPGFSFFTERLQDNCMITNSGCSAVRRESEALPRGCMVFSDRPLKATAAGLQFAVRVDGATNVFSGLPWLGFTRRRPTDAPGLYPAVASYLAQSILVGGDGEASARDGEQNFTRNSFRKPSQHDVATWYLDTDVPSHKRKAPAELSRGDILQCCYTWEGRILLYLNGAVLLDFYVGRPLDQQEEYFAAVDTCFSATSLTIVPVQDIAAVPRDLGSLKVASVPESLYSAGMSTWDAGTLDAEEWAWSWDGDDELFHQQQPCPCFHQLSEDKCWRDERRRGSTARMLLAAITLAAVSFTVGRHVGKK